MDSYLFGYPLFRYTALNLIGQFRYLFLHYSTDNYQHSACYLYTQRKILFWVPWFYIFPDDQNTQTVKSNSFLQWEKPQEVLQRLHNQPSEVLIPWWNFSSFPNYFETNSVLICVHDRWTHIWENKIVFTVTNLSFIPAP